MRPCRRATCRARELFFRQLPLLQCLMKGGLPPTVKAGLALRGFDVGTPRAPLQPLGEAATRELAAVLAGLAA